MANREELGIIRGARAGDATCQLALGKLYLFGGAGLPMSLPTALHWLNRAALQQQEEAWMLIGHHVPFEHARHCLPGVLPWYQRARDAGVAQAGLVLAQLAAPSQSPLAASASASVSVSASPSESALAARRLPAPAPRPSSSPSVSAASRSASAAAGPVARACRGPLRQAPLRMADTGIAAANYAMLDAAWHGAHDIFLQRALPLLQPLLARAPADAEAARLVDWPIGQQLLTLLSRCATLLDGGAGQTPEPLPRSGAELDAAADAESDAEPEPGSAAARQAVLRQCRELAAHGGDRHAQLSLALWFARMDADGKRQPHGIAAVNFKRAIRWLTLAGEQGLAAAWFALSRIYLKPEFSQRCVAEAQAYLERAAEMGHSGAQLECGMYAWRNRRNDEHGDVRALYWLQKAASQGCGEAEAALGRIIEAPRESAWAGTVAADTRRELNQSQPLLAARLELAELFGLSRAEALLLDVKAADQGHCLVVDIRASYGRSKRRLILLRTARERQALDRISRQFDQVDSGLDGLEGNYRQRLYRLKTWLPAAASDHLLAA